MGQMRTGWDYCDLMDPQERLDRFFEHNYGRRFMHEYLAMHLFFGDTAEEKKQLERWKKRHPDDFHDFGKEIEIYSHSNKFDSRAARTHSMEGGILR